MKGRNQKLMPYNPDLQQLLSPKYYVWKALKVKVKKPETQHATKLLVVLRCFHCIDIKQV